MNGFDLVTSGRAPSSALVTPRPAVPRPAGRRPSSHQRVLIGAACGVGLILVILAGCASPTHGGSLDRPLADYEDGEYEAASRSATDVMRRSNGQTHEEASYLSGLSAYRLGRLDEAEQRLTVAARSSDPSTAANASATLGLVRLDQGRPSEAAALFKTAASRLNGEDADQAERYAAAAYQLAGEERHASRDRSPAESSTWSSSPSASYGYGSDRRPNRSESRPTNRTESRPEPSLFALQVGAFTDRHRAERAATEARTAMSAAGLRDARIVPRTVDRGRRLYVVQFGRFQTRNAAAGARNRLGRLDYIVAPYVEATR